MAAEVGVGAEFAGAVVESGASGAGGVDLKGLATEETGGCQEQRQSLHRIWSMMPRRRASGASKARSLRNQSCQNAGFLRLVRAA